MIIVADIKRMDADEWFFDRYYSVPSVDETCLYIDMFDGTSVLEFKEQHQNLILSGQGKSVQEYTLLKTFIKWGTTHQEKIMFEVTLYQYRFKWIYLLKRFWYFKLLKKVDRGQN